MSTTKPTLPTIQQIEELFQMLVGRDVKISKTKKFHQFLYHPSTVGVYVDDKDGITGCCACDLSLSCYTGAALAMMPVTKAEEAAKAGELDPELTEHMHEVLNIMASLYPDAGGKHVRLSKMHCSPPLPRKLMPVMKTPSVRLDLVVEVDGYQGGEMILFAT